MNQNYLERFESIVQIGKSKLPGNFLANTTFETREIEYLSETLGTFVMNKVHKRMHNSSTDIPKYIGCYAAHSNSEILDGDIQSMGKFPHSTLF